MAPAETLPDRARPLEWKSAVPSGPAAGDAERCHLLTVVLEDYFHVESLAGVIPEERWYRFEMRLEASTRRALDLLDECGARATFFVLGWVADAAPEIVREVASRGHEIAAKGYLHRNPRGVSAEAFGEDALRAREALERAAGRPVLGYRVARGRLRRSDDWAVRALAACGYSYDSSVRPMLRECAAEPWRRFPHTTCVADRPFLEVPLSSVRLLGLDLPIAGGNYFRQLPRGLMRRAVGEWHRRSPAPFVMYFHTWELDPEQPRVHGAPLAQRIRQYRNLSRMPRLVRSYLESYRFTSIADYYALQPSAAGAAAGASTPGADAMAGWSHEPAGGARPPVDVVVPCYNEEQSLPYLANTLRSVVTRLRDRYRLRFIFVDDGSTDGTWRSLEAHFGRSPDAVLVRHHRNRGLAAAIQTGLRAATADIVCSMDCDCTYDPHELGRMIALLVEGVDVVTASPYHPEGRVTHVPGWRLVLSRGLSRLYRLVLRQKLHTYTSCFRVYRRQAVAGLTVTRGGYLGVAELLGRLDLAGRRIVEAPAVLEGRMLGRSKMRVMRNVVGHLGLLAELLRLRLAARGAPADHPAPCPVHD